MRFCLLVLFVFSSIISRSQTQAINKYPTADFRFPLDLYPSLAAAFGDLRPNHFHSGLDFRTNQREGYPVYAVADGFVSRLRVQIGGFGQAIYLDHPNGYTSVYAHLKTYSPGIAKQVKDYQYRLQSFEIDIPLIYSEIQVKKGDLIGWSGNTGSSGGPHLHFEIRDTKTEEIINPQLFGLRVEDQISPQIGGLYLYQTNRQPFSEQTPKQYFPVKGSNGTYQLSVPQTILMKGESGFGIVAFDKSTTQGSQNGLYQIRLSLDDQQIYCATWDRFSFEDTKAINSHLDYPAMKSSGIRIHKNFLELGNPLDIYQSSRQGLIELKDDQVHEIKYTISDVAGNQSSLQFQIKRNTAAPIISSANKKYDFVYNQDNRFSNDQIKLDIPKGTLYSSIAFEYASQPRLTGTYSARHRIHKTSTPIHGTYTLAIKAEGLPSKLQTKALIINAKNQPQGGAYENGFVKAELKAFDTFYITTDTLAPKITPQNINDGKIMTGISRMIFKIADNLSGIDSFTGKIDQHWILMEYDEKSNTLWHQFDERTLSGKHQFELMVSDKKGNISVYKANFIR